MSGVVSLGGGAGRRRLVPTKRFLHVDVGTDCNVFVGGLLLGFGQHVLEVVPGEELVLVGTGVKPNHYFVTEYDAAPKWSPDPVKVNVDWVGAYESESDTLRTKIPKVSGQAGYDAATDRWKVDVDLSIENLENLTVTPNMQGSSDGGGTWHALKTDATGALMRPQVTTELETVMDAEVVAPGEYVSVVAEVGDYDFALIAVNTDASVWRVLGGSYPFGKTATRLSVWPIPGGISGAVGSQDENKAWEDMSKPKVFLPLMYVVGVIEGAADDGQLPFDAAWRLRNRGRFRVVWMNRSDDPATVTVRIVRCRG